MKTTNSKKSIPPTKKDNRPFIKLDHAIKEAKALSRTTRELYNTLLWFQRGKDDCFPGYEKIMKRSDIRSKVTVSLHLKILIKTGLVKKERRGKKQSNIYKVVKADMIPDLTLKNLQRSHRKILDEIKVEDEKARSMREVKRELKNRKFIHPKRQKTRSNQCYPQQSEVQKMDFHSNVFQTSKYSSNRNNDSKLENEESGEVAVTTDKLHMKANHEGGVKNFNLRETIRQEINNPSNESLEAENAGNEKRGGGFKSFEEILKGRVGGRTNKKPSENFSEVPEPSKSQQNEVRAISKNTPLEITLQPLKEPSNLEAVIVKISRDIHDQKHERENKKQAKNIYACLKEKGVSEEQFIDTLFGVRGLTLEVINNLDRPGAYFFNVLRDRWKL